MAFPSVSVIIPVYNTAAYISETLKSICAQTLTNIEIIVVNDGSTDNSLEIIHRSAAPDPRISVYDQPNQGVSVARNKGMQQAKGEYIYFMDSDDLLEPEALEVCYRKCKDHHLDFVLFDATVIQENREKISVPNYKRNAYTNEEKVYNGIEILNVLLDNRAFSPSICLHLIRTAYLVQTRNLFYPGIIHEDQLFVCLLYIQAKQVMCIHHAYFKRRLRNNSIMTSRFGWKNIAGYLTVTDELLNYCRTQEQIVQHTIRKFLYIMLNAVIWHAHILPLKQKIKLFAIGLRKYPSFIKPKNWLVLFLKS